MITTLNVNQFLKKYSWKDLQGKYNEKNAIWKEIKEYYFKYIKRHIVTEEDLLVLHEVPFVKEEKCTYKGADKSKEICDVYRELEQYCEKNGLEILKPRENGFIVTIAIFKKGTYKRASTVIDMEFKKDYANRIIAVERTTVKAEEIIIGIHIPKECEVYWKQLINVHKELYEHLPKNKRIIYVGDLNTYTPGTLNKNKFYELLAKGLIDFWLEKGNAHTKETFDGGTRIDYVLMTGKDFNNSQYEITIDDDIRKQGYSDHSAVIIM